MEIKAIAGSRIVVLHDSRVCKKCKSYISFYENLKENKNSNSQEKGDSTDNGVKYHGIISYLRFIFKLEFKPTLLNGVENPSAHDFPSEISYDSILNEWNVKREIEKKKTLKKEVKLDDTTAEPKKDPLLLVCKEKTIDKQINKTNKIIFAEGSSSSGNHTKDSNHAKIPLRKSIWKTTEENPAKVNTSIKEPKLGTLKRKRWIFNQLMAKGNYEDDIYENKEFFKIQGMLEDNSTDNEIDNISTPTFPLTPTERSCSPIFEDCYNITELSNSRKEAEKYQFRRNKRRKRMSNTSVENNHSSRSKINKTEMKNLIKCCERLVKKKNDQENEDDDSDYYYSDIDDEEESD